MEGTWDKWYCGYAKHTNKKSLSAGEQSPGFRINNYVFHVSLIKLDVQFLSLSFYFYSGEDEFRDLSRSGSAPPRVLEHTQKRSSALLFISVRHEIPIEKRREGLL